MKYQKKPVVIDAIKFEYSESGINALSDFCGNALIGYGKTRNFESFGWAQIGTLEDGSSETKQAKHIATEGDYIIRGVSGEFYPCKPDIFHQTYSPVE